MSAPIDQFDNKTRKRRKRSWKLKMDPALPIYASGFLDLFGVSMILPLIMSHCRSLGASPTITGILGSSYGAIQLFSSPLVGQWSDISGRRFTLLLCLLMSACGYSLMSFATSISLMFVARAPLGIFKHSQNIEKSYLTDITPSNQYSFVLGNFNAASSFGFILGPIVGGHLAEKPGGFYTVAQLTGAIFMLNCVIMWIFGPESKTKRSDSLQRSESSATSLKKLQSDEDNINYTSFFSAFKLLDWSDLWDLYLIKLLAGSSVIIFRSNFSLQLMQKFEASPVTVGYIISFSSVMSTVVGFLSPYMLKLYHSNATVLLHANILCIFTMLCLAFSPSLWLFIVSLIPLSLISTIARVAATSLTIERGSKEMAGMLMGLQQSCMSVARMIAPLVSGIALEMTSAGPGLVSSILSLLNVFIMVLRPQDPRQRKKKQL